MGYSLIEGHVRIDLFKPSGKWKYTAVLDMSGYYNFSYHPSDAVLMAGLNNQMIGLVEGTFENWITWEGAIMVVKEPYHKSSYPVCIVGKEGANPEKLLASLKKTNAWYQEELKKKEQKK